jgi:hypothetical protein
MITRIFPNEKRGGGKTGGVGGKRLDLLNSPE